MKKKDKEKKEEKVKKKMGRPKIKIDQKAFEGLCSIQCTRPEICEWFHITDKTLDKWCRETYNKTFSAIFKIKRTGGLISLRRSGFQLAQTNAAMCIFLHKNLLGMKDVPIESDGENEAQPMAIEYVRQDAEAAS
jgi:hypothetical protein